MPTGRLHLPRSMDGWGAVGLVVAAAIEPIVRSHDPVYLLTNISGAPLMLLLAWRRSRPLLVITCLSAAGVVASLMQAWLSPHAPSDAYTPIFALLVAVYSLGAHGSRRAIVLGAPQPLLVMLVVDLTQPHSDSLASAIVFFSVFIIAVPVGAGRLVRGRTRMIEQLQEQARELAEQRTAYVHTALARERLRVTDDLHRNLAAGMQELVDAAGDNARIADLEVRARRLLAQTREAAVTLADTPASVEAVPANAPRAAPADVLSDAAQPWTALAATALAAGLLLEIRGLSPHEPRFISALACVVLALPLAFAWARPLLAVTGVWVAAVVFTHAVTPLGHTTSAAGLTFVLPFVVAALEPRRRALAGLAICCTGVLATFGPGAFPGDATLATACWLVGAGFRQRARLVTELHANNAALEQGRIELAAQAVDEERMRMARELHDALGHSLTVVALQAGAARRIWDLDRTKAEAMLDTVRTVARTGLAELQGGMATSTGRVAASLDRLLAGAQAAGLSLRRTIEDDALAGLTAETIGTIYRVVQEGLTNALKHSPGAGVAVDIRRVDGEVEVSIANTAPASPVVRQGRPGRGLSGMRERVEGCGGTLTHKPIPEGGYVVHARLPLVAVPA